MPHDSTLNQLICSTNCMTLLSSLHRFISLKYSVFWSRYYWDLLHSSQENLIIPYENKVNSVNAHHIPPMHYVPSTRIWLSMHRCPVRLTLNTEYRRRTKSDLVVMVDVVPCFRLIFSSSLFSSSLRFSFNFLKRNTKPSTVIDESMWNNRNKMKRMRRTTVHSKEITTKQTNGWNQYIGQTSALLWEHI